MIECKPIMLWLSSHLLSSQVSLSSASEPGLDDDDEGRQIFTSGGTAFLALNQTFALLAAALLGASLLGLLFLLGTNPGAGADQGGYGGSSGYGSGYGGGSGYGSHKTRREANWGKLCFFVRDLILFYFDPSFLRSFAFKWHSSEVLIFTPTQIWFCSRCFVSIALLCMVQPENLHVCTLLAVIQVKH